ncbi:ATP-binding protein [Kutzneria chonburiensis]|uniref:Tetratricopeptide repeat protein n=1 Tax=Kutzneria chonburiensis TaxID=1483604 RepID=A0ABV6MS99_9PSEU|nr:tetratricopeptide repeat protein [Kutzneria chonburiensis]
MSDSVVRRFRQRARLTQEELAARSGVSVRTIRGLETGDRPNPQLTSLRQLADAMDLTPADRDELMTEVLGVATVPTASPGPRQLPGAPTGFTGREAELAVLAQAIDAEQSPTIVISAIAGAGGIGKTTLALHWAHTHVDRFPDGQLFVDLRGFGPDSDPLDPLTAVRGFLDALGVDPAQVTGGLAEHTALYRSLITGKRLLIVLDNAASAEQVSPLLPGGRTCTVIVTSRRALSSLITRHGARHMSLAVLAQDEAEALLAWRLGDARVAAEPEAVADLIRLCGRYPLALAIMAARAQTHPDFPLAEFADELRELGLDALDDEEPTASLPAVLSWSLDNLSEQDRTVFGLLGTAPGPDISAPAAASLTGLSPAQVTKALRTLEEASLIGRQAHGRYGMHDMVRRYAVATADQLPEDMRTAAVRRVIDFYLHTGYDADRILNPHRAPQKLDAPEPDCQPLPLPAYDAALAWFDAEHQCLLAAQHTAVDHGWHRAAWQVAWTLTTFQIRRGLRHDQAAVWQIGLAADEHLDDPTALMLAHRFLGFAYGDLGRHDDAVRHLNESAALAEQHGDTSNHARTESMLARAWGLSGDYRHALEHANRALELYRTLEDVPGTAHALNDAGWCAAQLGRYDEARANCRAALEVYERHNDPDAQAGTLDSLGYIDHRTGDHQQAIEHYQRSLALRRGLGDNSQIANCLDGLGNPYAALGRRDEARAVWQEALVLFQAQQRHDDAARIERQLDAL